MINIRFFITCVLSGLVLSCSQQKQYTVLIDNANGLQERTEVVFNGSTIGRISKMKILPDLRILLTISIKNDFNIPWGSVFLVKTPLVGNTKLYLQKSRAFEFATKEDTLYAYLDTVNNRSLLDDTVKRKALNKIVEGFKELIENSEKDTSK